MAANKPEEDIPKAIFTGSHNEGPVIYKPDQSQDNRHITEVGNVHGASGITAAVIEGGVQQRRIGSTEDGDQDKEPDDLRRELQKLNEETEKTKEKQRLMAEIQRKKNELQQMNAQIASCGYTRGNKIVGCTITGEFAGSYNVGPVIYSPNKSQDNRRFTRVGDVHGAGGVTAAVIEQGAHQQITGRPKDIEK